MRLRNPSTGTVVTVSTASGKRLAAAGWETAGEAGVAASPAAPAEDTDHDGGQDKPKRRRSSK